MGIFNLNLDSSGLIASSWGFILKRSDLIGQLTLEHVLLVSLAILIAVIIGIFLGVLSSYYSSLAGVIIPFTQITMTVPSIALMGVLIPLVGIGFTNAIICLVIYSLLAIVRNTYTGITAIPDEILESAKGMGMTERWVLLNIKVPLALPVIIAGIRTAAVMIIGIGAIMAYIGAGGLGELIFRGISRTRPDMILTGALFVSLIAVFTDLIFSGLEKYLARKQA